MKVVLNGLKISVISIIEFVIMLFMYIPLVFGFKYVADRVSPDLWFSHFYQNIYTLIAMVLLYLVVGIFLFIFFKFVEVKLISKHEKDSYQYLFLPCIFLFVWEILYNILNVAGVDSVVLIWLPLNIVILVLNLVYEFVIIKKLKNKDISKKSKKLVIYILGGIVVFILGFLSSVAISNAGVVKGETYDFKNSYNMKTFKEDIIELNSLVEELNELESNKYSSKDLATYKTYFCDFATMVNKISFLSYDDERYLSINDISDMVYEYPIGGITNTIMIYESLGKYNEYAKENYEVYKKKYINILYVSDPGSLLIYASNNKYIGNNKLNEWSPAMNINFIIARFDYQIIDHIEIIKLILEK